MTRHGKMAVDVHGILGWVVQSLGRTSDSAGRYRLGERSKDMLAVGSLNLYMFHGGTNFGFYNGVRREVQKIYLKSLAMIMMLY